MHTWAIISQKGGQGKTTLATGFAVEAARDGVAVVILDTDDRQGTASYWENARATDDVTVVNTGIAVLPLNEIAQSLRLAPQCADQMMIIDRVAAHTVCPHAGHAHDRIGPKETFQPVIEETHFDLVANEPGGDGIEHPIDIDGAVACHLRRHHREVGGSALG